MPTARRVVGCAELRRHSNIISENGTAVAITTTLVFSRTTLNRQYVYLILFSLTTRSFRLDLKRSVNE